MRIGSVLVALALTAFPVVASQPGNTNRPMILGVVQSGKHAVGYKTMVVRDSTRPMGPKRDGDGRPRADRARAVTIHVWYPAAAATGPTLTLGEYVRAGASPDRDATAATADHRTFIGRLFPPALTHAEWDHYASIPMLATRDAQPASGRHPLLIGTFLPVSLTLTSEYLASHGYAVAFVQAPRDDIAADGPTLEALQMLQGIRDMELAVAALREQPFVDPVALGALGFSGSGLAQLPLAMRHADVDAVAQLDTGYFGPQGSSYRALPAYDTAVLRAPLFYAYSVATLSQHELQLGEIEKLRYAPRVVVSAKEPTLHHWDFATEGPAMLLLPGRRADARTGAARVNEAVHRHLLAFFDAYVRRNPAAREAVTRNQREPGPGSPIELQYRAAIEPALSRRAFRQLLDQNPVTAGTRVREGLPRDPLAPVFEEGYLNALGYELLNQRQGEKAIEVLRLNVDAHPSSANAMDSLSEAYELIGQRVSALDWAEKALSALPADTTVPAPQRSRIKDALEARIARLKAK